MFSTNLMYKYVDLISDIYLGCFIFCLYNIDIIKHMLWIFTSEVHFYHFFLKNKFIAILLCEHSLVCFIIILK